MHAIDSAALSLFQFGFTACSGTDPESNTVPRHMPDQTESGLGEVEYTNVVASVSSLADPQFPMKRKSRGKYFEYTDKI